MRRDKAAGRRIPDKRPVVAMLVTGMLLMLANMSIEPIITVYVAQIVPDPAHVTIVAGLVMSAAALGSILSASRLGKIADRIGHWTVIIGCLLVCAALLIPQAFVTAGWQLIGLRFLMGLSLGGLLPCVATVIRHNVPERSAGSMLGLFNVVAICRPGGRSAGRRLRRWAFRHAGGVPGDVGADGGGCPLRLDLETATLRPGRLSLTYSSDMLALFEHFHL